MELLWEVPKMEDVCLDISSPVDISVIEEFDENVGQECSVSGIDRISCLYMSSAFSHSPSFSYQRPWILKQFMIILFAKQATDISMLFLFAY